jgi:hypothetical protein
VVGIGGWAWELGVAAIVFALRLISLKFRWRVPKAVGPWHGDATLH